MKRQLETRLSLLEKEILSSYQSKVVRANPILSREVSEESMRNNFHFLTTDSLTGMTKG